MDYGEGTIRIDKATTFMIKMMRMAIKRWHLSAEAVELVWARAKECEDGHNIRGTLNTKRAIYGDEKELPPPTAKASKRKVAEQSQQAKASQTVGQA